LERKRGNKTNKQKGKQTANKQGYKNKLQLVGKITTDAEEKTQCIIRRGPDCPGCEGLDSQKLC